MKPIPTKTFKCSQCKEKFPKLKKMITSNKSFDNQKYWRGKIVCKKCFITNSWQSKMVCYQEKENGD